MDQTAWTAEINRRIIFDQPLYRLNKLKGFRKIFNSFFQLGFKIKLLIGADAFIQCFDYFVPCYIKTSVSFFSFYHITSLLSMYNVNSLPDISLIRKIFPCILTKKIVRIIIKFRSVTILKSFAFIRQNSLPLSDKIQNSRINYWLLSRIFPKGLI